jgi:hypothetical protein
MKTYVLSVTVCIHVRSILPSLFHGNSLPPWRYTVPVPLVDGEDGIDVDVGALELILLTIDSLS